MDRQAAFHFTFDRYLTMILQKSPFPLCASTGFRTLLSPDIRPKQASWFHSMKYLIPVHERSQLRGNRCGEHWSRASLRPFSSAPRRTIQDSPRYRNEDSENFWKVSAGHNEFWSAYVATRPHYSSSFYNLIYAHHDSHSSSWNVAHDVGCGAGQVTAELASRFQHVIASDNNDAHLEVARRRLETEFSDKKVSYKHSMGEQLAAHYPPSSADLIAVAEAMVLMDEKVSLRGFEKMLRPGGTLAFWFYGRPTFADHTLHANAQSLIDALMVRNWAAVIQGSGPRRQAGFKRAAEGMSSWLDYAWLDPSVWTDVHRIKWNTYGTLPFFAQEACGFPVESVNRVGAEDEVETIEDREWWRNDWNLTELKRYFQVLFPGFKDAVGEGSEEFHRIYDELEKIMGKRRVAFTWPVALVMATRK